MPNQIAPSPEIEVLRSSLEPGATVINIPSTGPQEFDLLATEREAMAAAGCPAELLPPLPVFTLEEGHRNVGGFGV